MRGVDWKTQLSMVVDIQVQQRFETGIARLLQDYVDK